MRPPAVLRWRRYREAERFFRRLYPLASGRTLGRLINLAVSYWTRPERYA